MIDECDSIFSNSPIIHDVVRKYGCKKQLLQLSEEIFELNKELNKYARNRGSIWPVLEEYVDVRFMLYQLQDMWDELLSKSNTNPELLNVFNINMDTKWFSYGTVENNILFSTTVLSGLSTASTNTSLSIYDDMTDEEISKLSDNIVQLIKYFYLGHGAMIYIKNTIIKEIGPDDFINQYNSILSFKMQRTIERMKDI